MLEGYVPYSSVTGRIHTMSVYFDGKVHCELKYLMSCDFCHIFSRKKSRVVHASHTEYLLRCYSYSTLYQPQRSRSVRSNTLLQEITTKEQGSRTSSSTQRQQIQEQKRLSSASPSQTWSATMQIILHHRLKQIALQSTGFGAAETHGTHPVSDQHPSSFQCFAPKSAVPEENPRYVTL